MSSLIALRGTGEVPLVTSSYRGPTSQIRFFFFTRFARDQTTAMGYAFFGGLMGSSFGTRRVNDDSAFIWCVVTQLC